MYRELAAVGLAWGLVVGTATADQTCGVGRQAVQIEGTVVIEPEYGECSLTDNSAIVRRYFPTRRSFTTMRTLARTEPASRERFRGGTLTVAGRTIDVTGTAYSAQYAGEAFPEFVVDASTGTRMVLDATEAPWAIGEANSFMQLFESGSSRPLLRLATDDTFFYQVPPSDSTDSSVELPPLGPVDMEKLTIIGPAGATGNLVIDGYIFSTGADLQGTLCVPTAALLE
jgi:hypothetical protein